MSWKINRFFAWILLRLLLCLKHSKSVRAELHCFYCYYRYDGMFEHLSQVDAHRLRVYSENVGSFPEDYLVDVKVMYGFSNDK